MNRNKIDFGRACSALFVRVTPIFVRSTIVLLTVATAFARTIEVPPNEPAATLRVPDQWTVQIEGEITQLISPDRQVQFLIVTIEHGKAAEAMGEVMSYLRNSFALSVDGDSMKKETGKVSRHDAHFVSWKAPNNGLAVEIRYAIFALAPNEGYLTASWGTPKALRDARTQLDRIHNSITRRSK